MSANQGPPRPIDHLVFPTASLDVARGRLVSLGFSVAPEGVHPFGTRNACVYLADGAFLEMLAIGDRAMRDRSVFDGNAFVERDKVFRETSGEEGLSAIVFATQDAAADHRRFIDARLSIGPMLAFSRPFVGSAGRSDIASFRLAFASVGEPGAQFLFTCERVNAPAVDRSALERHDNGVLSLAGVIIVAEDVGAVAACLALVAESKARSSSDRAASIAVAGSVIDVLSPRDFAARFGVDTLDGASDLSLVSFRVADLAATRDLLARNAVGYRSVGAALLVSPQPGQGAHFRFEENI